MIINKCFLHQKILNTNKYMSKEQKKRRVNLLYKLRQKGIRCLTWQFTIFFPYGEDPDVISEIRNLRKEFHFAEQFEIV